MQHGRQILAYTYSDLPVFDMIFRTFKNPAECVKENGFYIGASSRVKEMLLFKEVDKE